MAKWIIDETYDDGYEHHKCSHCNTLALFDYVMEEDYDEGVDGEWFSLGIRENGINEHITKFCPECGEKMDCAESITIPNLPTYEELYDYWIKTKGE